jgi:hypothetical protein
MTKLAVIYYSATGHGMAMAPNRSPEQPKRPRRRVQALRRSRLTWPVPVIRYPRVRRVNYLGLATRRTKEVVDMLMRGSGGMLSNNFSSSCHL